MKQIPIVVDLDGTLLKSDVFYELIINAAKTRPFLILKLPFLLFYGKAYLKNYLANEVFLDLNTLPYREDLLMWLANKKKSKTKLVLCTATHVSIANKIANSLQLFDEVIASDLNNNIKGTNKRDALNRRYGQFEYDYVGNSFADISVWKSARESIVVGSNLFIKILEYFRISVTKSFNYPFRLKTVFKLMRVHQWIKNVLIFIPLITAHEFMSAQSYLTTFTTFISFCFLASAVYILNDLFDIGSDRLHPQKKSRPLANGDLSIIFGAFLFIFFASHSLIYTYSYNSNLAVLFLMYFALNIIYTTYLKTIALVDVILLAFFYCLRIFIGIVALALDFSFWLLSFSFFLFYGLALLKRASDLINLNQININKLEGRDYFQEDINIISILGIASSFAGAVLLALYINSAEVQILYENYLYLWGLIPIYSLWLSSAWLKALRGLISEDPVIFVFKDKESILLGILFLLIILLAI